jgi:hypothetical protein
LLLLAHTRVVLLLLLASRSRGVLLLLLLLLLTLLLHLLHPLLQYCPRIVVLLHLSLRLLSSLSLTAVAAIGLLSLGVVVPLFLFLLRFIPVFLVLATLSFDAQTASENECSRER